MVLVHQSNTVCEVPLGTTRLTMPIAEHRGPGSRQRLETSDDEWETEHGSGRRGMGGRSGRIIILGDGSEVLTDSDDQEMFDQEEEDKDIGSQVGRGVVHDDKAVAQAQREGTPGPEPNPSSTSESPASTTTEHSPSQATGPKTTADNGPPGTVEDVE